MHRPRSLQVAPGRLALAAAALLLAAAPAAAQTVDYRRAELFLNWNASTLVSGDQVNPVWLQDGNRFWYRNKVAAGHEFVIVDPVRNTRGPVFDHARLAAAMSVANDTSYEAHKLPFQRFDFSKDSERVIEFSARRKRWVCDISRYSCTVMDTLPNRMAFVASPDSTWEAFAHRHNLWIRPVGGGDSIQLTTDGELYYSYGVSAPRPNQRVRPRPVRPQVVWSPDSRRLAVYRADERNVEHMHYVSMTHQRPRHFSQPYALPGDSIVPLPSVHVIDIGTKANVRVALGEMDGTVATPRPNQLSLRGSPMDSIWAPTSDRIRFHYLTRGSKSMYLVEADAATGATRILARDTSRTWVEPNPQGGASWKVTDDGQDVIWWSQRDGWGHLYRYGPDGRLKNQITSGAWQVGHVVHVDQQARQVYFIGRGREADRHLYYGKLYRVNYDGSRLELLTPEDAHHDIRFSPSGRYFVDTYSRIEQPPVTVLRDRNGRVIRTLETADVSRLAEKGWQPGQVFSVKARDGVTDLYGVIWFPSNLDPTKKYPVIEYIYPGPQVGSVGRWAFTPGGEHRAMAELGFIVVQLDHLGTPLRSKAFHDNYYGNFGDNGIPDHIIGLKQLAARYPFMDLDRVGIWGHSGGGFASTGALFRYPDFYKVAVSGAGNHDNRSYNIYWAEKYQGLMERDSVRRTDNFALSANATHAGGLQGKLLLMHGDMDDNVHPAMTMQVVDALIKANKDFDLVIAPNRAHSLNEPYFIRRRWDFFVRHLMGAQPPANHEILRLSGGGGPFGDDDPDDDEDADSGYRTGWSP
jgi:dipeptidyl-peptidase 4